MADKLNKKGKSAMLAEEQVAYRNLRGEARIALTNLQSEAYLVELAFAQNRYGDVILHLGKLAKHAEDMTKFVSASLYVCDG